MARSVKKKRKRAPRSPYRTANIKYVRAVKASPCADCGQSYPYYVMDLDHREPDKKYKGVASMMRFPTSLVIAEVAKCDVVCANCHRERTWGKKKRTPAP